MIEKQNTDNMNGRFEYVYSQGGEIAILVDKATGVNYLATSQGGLTVLLNADGSPVITPLNNTW